MWARVVEVCLGCWLLASPFIFRTPGGDTLVWTVDLAGGLLIVTIALVALWPPVEKLHYAQLAVAAALVIVAFVTVGAPAPPPYQNFMVVALLLLVVGLIPTRATLPPRSWETWLQQAEQRR